MKIKEKWASLFIPKNTPYCHHNFSKTKRNGISAKACRYFCYKYDKIYGYKREYCRYLKDFLWIQDQVKDCEINLDSGDE